MNVELTDLWNWLVLGVILGGVYAVAATGLVVTYTTSGIFNFAHGAVGMLAAFAYWQVTVEWGWSPLLGLLVVVLLCSPLLGAVVERVILRGLGSAPEVARIVVTVALMVARAALWREESRGGHYRVDFPARDDARWRVHSVVQKDAGITPAEAVDFAAMVEG